ncbi:hypothetical protein EDB19DRAFT_582045 [Suillus lakei]|nr:hypothetical protein EDB19DRAFT_582045 [Suillus lakei]
MAMTASPSYAGHASGGNASPGPSKRELSASPSKRGLTPSPARHLPRISLADVDSPSLSPTTLSPSSSRFTAEDNIYEDEDTDAPTVRVRNPSTRDSYAVPSPTTLDEYSQHQDTPPTLRAPISRPIRIRHSTRPRPRSYHDILEDFEVHARGESMASSVATSLGAVAEERASRIDDRGYHEEFHGGGDGGNVHGGGEEIRDGLEEEDVHNGVRSRQPREPIPRYTYEKKEDTARKKKRFSLPAVAVQTVPVSGSEREGSTRSSLLSDQSVRPPSRGDKAGKGGESSAARALMDVLRGRRGKEKA